MGPLIDSATDITSASLGISLSSLTLFFHDLLTLFLGSFFGILQGIIVVIVGMAICFFVLRLLIQALRFLKH